MLSATKSEILDPENRNKSRPNLPPGEMRALARLIELQKQQQITIKPCDKGAGIMILDFQEYIRAFEQSDGSEKPYYEEVEEEALEEMRRQVNEVVEEAFNNNVVKKEEYEEMRADEKTAGRFYATFKAQEP